MILGCAIRWITCAKHGCTGDWLIHCWRQAIIWTNAGILLIGALGTNQWNLNQNWCIFFQGNPFEKMSSGKWRPFCLGLSVLFLIGQNDRWLMGLTSFLRWGLSAQNNIIDFTGMQSLIKRSRQLILMISHNFLSFEITGKFLNTCWRFLCESF